MGLVVEDDGWRIPERVWAHMEPLLPERPAHPLGCHDPRVPDRDAMNAILLVLRTYSRSCGGAACSPTTMTSGSSGSGWRWTARSARRRWAGSTRARILRIEQKKGETIAPH